MVLLSQFSVVVWLTKLCGICGKGNGANYCCCSGACGASCFPGRAKVELQNGKSVTIAGLKMGIKFKQVCTLNTNEFMNLLYITRMYTTKFKQSLI